MRLRILLLVLVAAALAAPAGALADRGHRSTAPSLAATHAARAEAARAKKAERAKVLARTRAAARATRLAKARERELVGRVVSLSPLTVVSGRATSSSLTCDVPTGRSLGTLQVGDRVEVHCVLVGERWVLRELEREHAETTRGPGSGGTGTCDDESGKLDDDDDDDEDEDDEDDEDEDGEDD